MNQIIKNAQYWVEKFEMLEHPEGGYFAETYRSTESIPQEALPERFKGKRVFSTGIYFLLENHHFSAFHRIEADEMWHFYAGGALDVFMISPDGQLDIIHLGNNPDEGQVFQAVVPAGYWFASKPQKDSAYSLVGCTVAPGFDFEGFELAERVSLQAIFPQHHHLIESLTR